MSSPYVILVSDDEDRVLAARVASGRTEYRDRVRAQIVVEAAHGGSNTQIAEDLGVSVDEDLGVSVDTVRTWRARFFQQRMKGLKDRPRSGRPPVHGPKVRAEVVALACALPAEQDVPLSRWSCTTLIPFAYRLMITAFSPSNRVACFGTSTGLNDPSRSRGTASRTGPTSVFSVLTLAPFRRFTSPSPPGPSRCASSSAASPACSTCPITPVSSPPGPVSVTGRRTQRK